KKPSCPQSNACRPAVAGFRLKQSHTRSLSQHSEFNFMAYCRGGGRVHERKRCYPCGFRRQPSKKASQSINQATMAGPIFRCDIFALHVSLPPKETFMTRRSSQHCHPQLRGWMFAALALAVLGGSSAMAADEPDLI